MNTKKGFTLIELLVVISIIGTLSSVVLTSTNSARTKARNSAVQQQVKQYINAINLIANSGSGYPTGTTPGTQYCLGGTTGMYCSANATIDANLNNTLNPYVRNTPNPNQTAVKVSGQNYRTLYSCPVFTAGKPCRALIIYYMEGNLRSTCKLGVTEAYDYLSSEGNTICQLILPQL